MKIEPEKSSIKFLSSFLVMNKTDRSKELLKND